MSRYLTIDGKPVLDPGPLYEAAQRLGTPTDFWGRANSYTCPLGQEPGSCWLMLDRATIDSLDVNATHTLKWYSEYNTLTVQSLIMVRATCMGLDGDSKAAYLVEFQDIRCLLKMSAITAQYNVRDSAGTIYTDTKNAGTAYTWQQMLAAVWTELPDNAGAAPTLPYTPAGTPENFRFIGISAWDAVGQIMDAIGCAVKLDPRTDTFTVVRLGQTQTGLQSEVTTLTKRLLYDYKPKQNLYLGTMPETIVVMFPKQRHTDWEIDQAHIELVTTGVSGAGAGTKLIVWDTLVALCSADGTVSNTAALEARAAEIGANLESRIDVADERDRLHYAGIATTILPGSEIREVVWRDYADGHGVITEIKKMPLWFKPPVTASVNSSSTIMRGVTVDAIDRTTPGEVDLWHWNGSDYAATGDSVMAAGFLLNSAETIEAGTAVFIIHLPDNTWEVLSGNCEVADW